MKPRKIIIPIHADDGTTLTLTLSYRDTDEAEGVYAELDRLYRIFSKRRVQVRAQINAWRRPL